MHAILIALFLVSSSGQPSTPLGTVEAGTVDVHGSEVQLTLTRESARSFAAITRAHVGDKVAISVGGKVLSTPVIRDPIETGKVSITLRSPDEAAALARSIRK